MPADPFLELSDWRRQVAGLWVAWREGAASDPEAAALRFREAHDRLLLTHPQSPLPAERRNAGQGTSWWAYDPEYRMTVPVEPLAEIAGPHDEVAASGGLGVPSSGPGGVHVRRVGRVTLGGPLAGLGLSLLWIDGYGNGLFLPLRDATSGTETHGAGRYLLDTAKSADHGGDPSAGTLTLDFNLLYHPSCAYDPRWVCPLAPPENRLPVALRVGERLA